MSSRYTYQARHRAASNHTLTKAAAGTVVAGAIAVAPLVLSGSPAQAASAATWDKLAQCESSGNWATNTGNGFSGGLQFTDQTWQAYGGGSYASSAYQASRSQQILVAEKVLAGQGWGAWPACSSKLGLSGSDAGGSPGVSSGSSSSSSSDNNSSSSSSSDDNSSSSSSSSSSDNNSGSSGSSSSSSGSDRSVQRSDRSDRPSESAPQQTGDGHAEYTVKSGDTLNKIAKRENVSGGWHELYNRNADRLSSPNLIFAGESLDVH